MGWGGVLVYEQHTHHEVLLLAPDERRLQLPRNAATKVCRAAAHSCLLKSLMALGHFYRNTRNEVLNAFIDLRGFKEKKNMNSVELRRNLKTKNHFGLQIVLNREINCPQEYPKRIIIKRSKNRTLRNAICNFHPSTGLTQIYRNCLLLKRNEIISMSF